MDNDMYYSQQQHQDIILICLPLQKQKPYLFLRLKPKTWSYADESVTISCVPSSLTLSHINIYVQEPDHDTTMIYSTIVR